MSGNRKKDQDKSTRIIKKKKVTGILVTLRNLGCTMGELLVEVRV